MKEYQVINILEGIYEECVRDNDKDYMERNTALTEAVKALTEIQYYRAIGTVEECREAREKQRGKKPVYRSIFTDGTRLLGCPVCFSRIDGGVFYCNGCGQKLDWSDTP